MTTIESLSLPDARPTAESMLSWEQCEVFYEPVFWEHEYQHYRYLSNVELNVLQRRYIDIAKNLIYLVSSDRHVISIHTFLSSWYWYRKKYQTRLELHMRGYSPPIPLPQVTPIILRDGPQRPRHPNAGNVLYRYANQTRIDDLAQRGAFRMWNADFYAKLEKDPARQDEEMTKDRFLHGPSTVITTMSGNRMPIIGDVKDSHQGPDYYLLCMSCDWDQRLFDDFGVSHCAVISDVDGVAEMIESTTSALMPSWLFHHNPVEYFDPYELSPQHITHTMAKDFRFAYQREYRFVLMCPNHEEKSQQHLDIEIGPMDGYLEIWPR